MITDNLKNIYKYNEIPNNAKNFIKNLTSEMPCGRYEIDECIYANIDTYEPKSRENCLFESHKKYIDIQILLSGKESLEYTHIDNLKIKIPYDTVRDVMFYDDSTKFVNNVVLGNENFVLLYPYEAHKPQIKITEGNVKKVVIKISCEDK